MHSAKATKFDGRTLRQFSHVVDCIYEAALAPDRWPIFVEAVANLHDCPRALLLSPATSPRDGGFMFPFGISEADMQIWATKYSDHDPWVKAARDKNVFRNNTVVFSEEVLSRQELESTLFFREYLAPMNIGHFCTGLVFDGTAPNTIPVACSFLNGLQDKPFGPIHKEIHALTVTHLSRALGVMFRLRDAELRLAANIAALNRLAVGVLLFAERGNIVFTNARALTYFGAGDGLSMRTGNPMSDALGWLSAKKRDDDDALNLAITEAATMDRFPTGHFSAGVAVQRASGRRPYLVQVSALPRENEFSRQEKHASAIAFISDLDASPFLDQALLVRSFGLTKAEATLAQELLSGDGQERIAQRIGISENTVKTQLQSIYNKTDTHRQAQLVKFLLSISSSRG